MVWRLLDCWIWELYQNKHFLSSRSLSIQVHMDLPLQYWWLLCVAKCNTRKLPRALVPANLCSSRTGLDHLQDNLECYLHLLHHFCVAYIFGDRVSTCVILIIDSIDMSVCWLRKSFSWWILLTMTSSPKCNVDHRFLVWYT